MLYTKTDAGRAAIQTRSRDLSALIRTVLILCDGVRTFEDLGRVVPKAALVPALQQLVASGHLQELAASKSAPDAAALGALVPANPVAPSSDATDSTSGPLEVTSLDAAERFTTTVNLAATLAAELGFLTRMKTQLQIERAQTMSDLSEVVEVLNRQLQGKASVSARLGRLRQLTVG